MKNFILIALIASVYTFTGCGGGPEKPVVEETRKVLVFFSAKSNANSVLKASPATEEEKLISRVLLFGLDGQGKVQEKYAPIDNPSASGTPVVISSLVTKLYAVANPSEAMVLANAPTDEAELKALTADLTAAPQSPFVMGGVGTINNYNVNVELYRTVAKVSFTGAKGFAIESIAVDNTPDEGFVFAQGIPAVPSSAERIPYSAVETATPVVYVAENTQQNPTQFVVTGKFGNNPATYRFELLLDTRPIDIVRNTHYQVEITPTTEVDCTIHVVPADWEVGLTDPIVIPDDAVVKP